MDSRANQKSKSERHAAMPRNVLIVDELATNRIVLKVKLSAARRIVHQATSLCEARKSLATETHDLVIASCSLSGTGVAQTVKTLRDCPGGASLPIVMMLAQDDPEARLAALRAGANEVITKPFDDAFLLARLRALMRQHHADNHLQLHAGTADALGFADAPDTFQGPARTAIVAQPLTTALQLRADLMHRSKHDMAVLTFGTPGGLSDLAPPPDVIVLNIASSDADDGLRIMSEVRADPGTHNSRVLALLSTEASPLAATLLDMGASDVLCGPYDNRELALRLQTQVTQKRREEALRRKLETGLQAAVTDQLTGLHNRRYALPHTARAIAEAAKAARPLAVMVADLDYFKLVNDRYGHAAGDAVLRQVAKILRNTLRDEDLVARIGGEEFLIVLPDTNRKRSSQVAARLCQAVRDTPIPVAGRSAPVHVTLSIGVAQVKFSPNRPVPDAETLIAQADRALYGAKAGGRNTVSLCEARPAA
jgi:two-component system cell cycle response regulator